MQQTPNLSQTSKPFNRSIVFDKNGSIKDYYNKIYLCDLNVEKGPQNIESAFIASGKEPKVVDLGPLGKWGLSICFDLRFPELYQALRSAGAEIINIPAAFFYETGEKHWHTLLRARAIETQSYVVAAAQVGAHSAKRRSFGHSMVINPWGDVLCDMHAEEGLSLIKIDLEYVKSVRKQIPLDEIRKQIRRT